jgi:Arc/MetJ family transcription regulator
VLEHGKPVRYLSMARQISKTDKTSMAIDRQKVAEAREILGTKTMASTVDAALDEVIRLEARRRLWDYIRERGGIGPSPEELRRLRTP